MTADTAKEIITEELKNDMPTPLRNAMNMAVTALGVWDHYQDIEYDYKKQGEMLGGILLSIHNLHYLLDLMRRARQAVLDGEFEAFYQNWMNSPAAKDY